MVSGEWVPIAFFLAAAAVLIAIAYFRHERAKLEAHGGGDYRRLAEEAVQGQRTLLEEMRTMNASLAEIERLLKEV